MQHGASTLHVRDQRPRRLPRRSRSLPGVERGAGVTPHEPCSLTLAHYIRLGASAAVRELPLVDCLGCSVPPPVSTVLASHCHNLQRGSRSYNIKDGASIAWL
jgi:hypothetical protein